LTARQKVEIRITLDKPKHRFPEVYRHYVKTKAQRECRKSSGRPDLECYRRELKEKLGE
jgi:hypothetical protein